MQKADSGKSIAVMQPYLFPYIGYIQLVDAVDEFWVYDCVQYIRRGWMNRNQVLVNGKTQRFSVSVERGSIETSIQEKRYSPNSVVDCGKLAQTLRHSGSPFRLQAADLVKRLMDYLVDPVYELSFPGVTTQVLKDTCAQFGVCTPMRFTSELAISKKYEGQSRILEVCRLAGASRYVNPLGGAELYDASQFHAQGIDLSFLTPAFQTYPQARSTSFIPKMSVLDMVANLPLDSLNRVVQGYAVE